VLYSLTYVVVRLLLQVLIVRGRPNATLGAEVLALRHQLRVLERQLARVPFNKCDRQFKQPDGSTCAEPHPGDHDAEPVLPPRWLP
jgi:hypothetical protein